MTTIAISEHFYSIQGEGASVGVPAVFLRLKGCNLNCGRRGKNATWQCDTFDVWTKGNEYTIPNAIRLLIDHYATAFANGARLIITGGEPLLQCAAIVELLQQLQEHSAIPSFIIEIETNGTITPSQPLTKLINQWNVSPKLINSGEKQSDRIKPEALTWFESQSNAYFKFVIFNKQDIDTIFNEFAWVKMLPIHRRYLMPAADSKESLISLMPSVIDLCKLYGFTFGQRLHIDIWDQKTGI